MAFADTGIEMLGKKGLGCGDRGRRRCDDLRTPEARRKQRQTGAGAVDYGWRQAHSSGVLRRGGETEIWTCVQSSFMLVLGFLIDTPAMSAHSSDEAAVAQPIESRRNRRAFERTPPVRCAPLRSLELKRFSRDRLTVFVLPNEVQGVVI